ncbi:hypothetical protein E6Q11_04515 [Candidatus Dojkabacteria bacterium]|uniref:Uncharacterized protein n=1 Tax=Candidatus Dojkabacteria bacterium TaxID=2099670 RepID=A0A5C7J5Q0_9BACT|nr:MAG: hypothetical protein E6Q11_04515 [Candidatus Dojkabacteria bacterium]
MTEADNSGRLSDKDERDAEIFLETLGIKPGDEVPTIASRNMGMGSASTSSDQIDPTLPPPYRLLTPDKVRDLVDRNRKSGRVYRQGINDAADLPLG